MNVADIVEKFDDCSSCLNFGKQRICRNCDSGEMFDAEDDVVPIDKIITDDY